MFFFIVGCALRHLPAGIEAGNVSMPESALQAMSVLRCSDGQVTSMSSFRGRVTILNLQKQLNCGIHRFACRVIHVDGAIECASFHRRTVRVP